MKSNISSKGVIATPGGIVPYSACGTDGTDLVGGLRKWTLHELQEEAGLFVATNQLFYKTYKTDSPGYSGLWETSRQCG